MAQSHYFTNDDTVASSPVVCGFEFNARRFTFTTDSGVFSRGKIDAQSEILLRVMYEDCEDCRLFLDLGCGYGFVGIVWKALFPDCRVVMSDVNERAVNLTRRNAAENGVTAEILTYDGVPSEKSQDKYDVIALNPPIHAGKEVIHRLYEEAANALSPRGALYVVIAKKHGAESAKPVLERLFGSVTAVYKKKGVFVYKCNI